MFEKSFAKESQKRKLKGNKKSEKSWEINEICIIGFDYHSEILFSFFSYIVLKVFFG